MVHRGDGSDDTTAEGVAQVVQFLADKAVGVVEGQPVNSAGIDADQKEHVQLHVQVESRAKALDQGDRAGKGVGRQGTSQLP